MVLLLSALGFLCSSEVLLAGQATHLRKSNSKSEESNLDPALRNIEGPLSFDEMTKEAFKRGKKPGELIGESPQADRVYRITISGAKKVEPDAIVLRLNTKIGHFYDPTLVAQDVREIYKLGLFSQVEVKKHQLKDSRAYELEYVLTEIPTIFQIKITGNEVLNDQEIKEVLSGLENYQGATMARLQENREKIHELYVSKGYYLAKVSYELRATAQEDIERREKEGIGTLSPKGYMIDIDTTKVLAPDFVDVVFKIEEKSKVEVERIYFVGNYRLNADAFRPFLRTHERHALSILNDMGTFRKDYLEIDSLIIEKILQDNGMLKAKVLPPLVELSPDKSTITIGFRMIEGEQYRIGEVSIEGDKVEHSEMVYRLRQEAHPDEPVFFADNLLKEMGQQQGDIFNKSLMAQNIMAISEIYRDKGYAYANISPIPLFDEENKSISIKVQIESGPRVRIERIDVEGNEKTKDEVIRRELEIIEGDYYSSTSLRLSENNVVRLGYFEKVEVTNEPGTSSESMVVKIKVKEQSTGNIQAGAGYGTGGEGFVLRGQVSNQNLFGRGQTLSAQINYSNNRKEFDVMFIEPYLFYAWKNPVTFAFTAYNRRRVMGEFTRSAIGGDVTFGYPVGGPWSSLSKNWKSKVSPSLVNYVFDFDALFFYMTYTLERIKISELMSDVRKWDLYQGVPRYTTSIRPTLRLDQRDNRIFPTRGIYAEIRADIASEYLGSIGLARLENHVRSNRDTTKLSSGRDYLTPPSSANNFIKYGANLRLYHNLDEWFFLKGFVLKTNLELGILDSLGNPLLFENYALGGANSIRGYAYRSISPTEKSGAQFPFDRRRDLLVGGNKQFYGSFELEFPLIKALKLGGVIFFDFGNVYSYEDNFFYIGGKSQSASRVHPTDPLKLYSLLGLYSSVGFGLRWQSPLGYLRFEWGIPLNRRPANTPGIEEGDRPIGFEFNIGPSF